MVGSGWENGSGGIPMKKGVGRWWIGQERKTRKEAADGTDGMDGMALTRVS